MTFRTHCEIAQGRIDPAPMVDIVFLLLIFIILSSPFVLQYGQRVELPTDKNSRDASFQTLVVTISRDNLYFFNGKPTTLDGLRQSLAREARQIRNAELIIKADRQVSHETVVIMMGLAFETGISSVNLATRPEVPASAQPK